MRQIPRVQSVVLTDKGEFNSEWHRYLRGIEEAERYNIIGDGDPEGEVAAPVGATFRRRDGGASSSFYVKESGGDTSSGWVAK